MATALRPKSAPSAAEARCRTLGVGAAEVLSPRARRHADRKLAGRGSN